MVVVGRASGLGKELGTILLETADARRPARVAPDPPLAPLAEDAIRHGLDAMCVALPLDLCGYVHLSDGCGPRVALRAPERTGLLPSDVFDLLTAARPVLDRAPAEAPVRAGGFSALAVATAGTRSRGLHVVGRRGHGLSRGNRRVAVALARAFGNLCHSLEAIDPTLL